MRAVVVYESMFGNTHAIADAIGRGIGQGLEPVDNVVVVPVVEAGREPLGDADLLVVGGPTHFHGMSSTRTRKWAASITKKPKNDLVLDGALKSLEICKKAGVKVGYGSDLLGPLQIEQSREFLFRAEVLKPIEIIRQATIVGAEILRQEGKLGIVAPGAFADLIVVDGNPLKKLELFLDQGAHLPAIMKAGKFHKNALK